MTSAKSMANTGMVAPLRLAPKLPMIMQITSNVFDSLMILAKDAGGMSGFFSSPSLTST